MTHRKTQARRVQALWCALRHVGTAGLAVATLAGATAHAQAPGVPTVAPTLQNVLNLGSMATVEVTKDVLSVTLSTARDGPDAAAVQSALKQALDAALTEAKKAAKPAGVLEVRTGGFSIAPRYGKATGASSGSPAINGWQGSTELHLSGTDVIGVAQLAGRITTLTIARVSQDLSGPVREKAHAEASAKAITAFRADAAEFAKQFGYGGYTIREVSVSSDASIARTDMAMARVRSTADAVPVEMGQASVTATVSGSVQMTR
jgi:predicted secreted protein